jgi:hypothetical protein
VLKPEGVLRHLDAEHRRHLPAPLISSRTVDGPLAPSGAAKPSIPISKDTICRLLEQSGFVPIELRDRRILLSYTFGDRSLLLTQPNSLAYAAVFAPLAYLAPLVHAGNDMVVIAHKKAEAA